MTPRPRLDRLRVVLVVLLLLTGGCLGLVVEQPPNVGDGAVVLAQWAGGQLLLRFGLDEPGRFGILA